MVNLSARSAWRGSNSQTSRPAVPRAHRPEQTANRRGRVRLQIIRFQMARTAADPEQDDRLVIGPNLRVAGLEPGKLGERQAAEPEGADLQEITALKKALKHVSILGGVASRERDRWEYSTPRTISPLVKSNRESAFDQANLRFDGRSIFVAVHSPLPKNDCRDAIYQSDKEYVPLILYVSDARSADGDLMLPFDQPDAFAIATV